MKLYLYVAVITLIVSCISMAQDTSSTHENKIQLDMPQLENYEPYSSSTPQQKTTIQDIQNEQSFQVSGLLSEINDSLLAIIKMVESRDSEIKKLIQYEQMMPPKDIMIKRLRFIRYLIKEMKQNGKGISQ